MNKKGKVIRILSLLLMVATVLFTKVDFAQAAPKKFNKTKEQIKKDISGYSITIKIDDEEQKFVIESDDITKFTISSKKYSSNNTVMTVKGTIYINRVVAKLRASYTVKYTLKNNKWKVSSVSFSKQTLTNIYLKGYWEGTYGNSSGLMKAQADIKEVSKDGFASGVFYFSPTPTNPKTETGSYTITGGYDLSTGKVTLAGDEWVEQPSGWSMIDFYGHVDLAKEKIVANYELSIKRVD